MNWKRGLAVAGLGAVIAGSAYHAYEGIYDAYRERAYYQQSHDKVPLKPGVKAPVFEGNSLLDGTKVALSELESKIVLLDFWSTSCGPCISLMPDLEALYQECRKDGLEVISIATDDDAAKVQAFLKDPKKAKYRTSYAKLHDKDHLIEEAYVVTALPTLVLIQNGQIISTSEGAGPGTLRWLETIKSKLKKK